MEFLQFDMLQTGYAGRFLFIYNYSLCLQMYKVVIVYIYLQANEINIKICTYGVNTCLIN